MSLFKPFIFFNIATVVRLVMLFFVWIWYSWGGFEVIQWLFYPFFLVLIGAIFQSIHTLIAELIVQWIPEFGGTVDIQWHHLMFHYVPLLDVQFLSYLLLLLRYLIYDRWIFIFVAVYNNIFLLVVYWILQLVLLLTQLQILINAQVYHFICFSIKLETFLGLLQIMHKQLKIKSFIFNFSATYFKNADVSM